MVLSNLLPEARVISIHAKINSISACIDWSTDYIYSISITGVTNKEILYFLFVCKMVTSLSIVVNRNHLFSIEFHGMDRFFLAHE